MSISLEFHRQMLGMSQVELARRSGITAAAISMLETTGRDPMLSTAIKLAKALDITLDELAGLSPPKSKRSLTLEGTKMKLLLEQIHELSS